MTGLIVAGFHRSGTSSVAQMLESYGLSLGNDLMEGNEFNKFGHFEAWPVVRFHDEVLSRRGSNWSKILDEPIAFNEEECLWVKNFVKQRQVGGADWVLKDPRICRFVRQWKEVAPDLKFLIVYRNPAESCQSLIRRSNVLMARSGDTDNIARRFYHDSDLALRLWVEHNRELVDFYRSYPADCIVLGYHHIVRGYDFIPALSAAFDIRPTRVPERGTIDREAYSSKDPELFCGSEVLIGEAIDTWHALNRIDICNACGQQLYDIGHLLRYDPDGVKARARMADMQMPELYRKIREQHTFLNELQLQLNEQLALAKMARSLAIRISKPPLSIYFMSRKKYRQIIEKVLSS